MGRCWQPTGGSNPVPPTFGVTSARLFSLHEPPHSPLIYKRRYWEHMNLKELLLEVNEIVHAKCLASYPTLRKWLINVKSLWFISSHLRTETYLVKKNFFRVESRRNSRHRAQEEKEEVERKGKKIPQTNKKKMDFEQQEGLQIHSISFLLSP